jgi:phosphatidylglycerol:prolipoprotein diacylglycerol transferase
MSTIAFSLGSFVFHWYGLIIAFALFSGLMISLWQSRAQGEHFVHIVDLVLYAIPVGIIMARIYYVLLNWTLYVDNPSELFFIWHGGLALDGALLGGILTIFVYTRVHNLDFWRWADIIAPGAVLGQAIGQWGKLINQESFGYPTYAPWGIYIDFAYRPKGYEQYDFFHPIFLYESGWDLAIFLLLLIGILFQIRYHRIQTGSIFLVYILLHSIGRFMIEEFRFDGEIIFGFYLTPIICIVSTIIALWMLAQKNCRLHY